MGGVSAASEVRCEVVWWVCRCGSWMRVGERWWCVVKGDGMVACLVRRGGGRGWQALVADIMVCGEPWRWCVVNWSVGRASYVA